MTSSRVQSIANFQISSTYSNGKKFDLTAIVLPRITCNLPVSAVPFDLSWNHLSGLSLADPALGESQCVNLLLGADIFAGILLHGQRTGPPGSPIAMETKFGWVLCGGNTDKSEFSAVNSLVTTLYASALCSDEIFHKFWEIKEVPVNSPILTLEEHSIFQHFESNHSRTKAGRFIMPLPRKLTSKPISESRSQAMRRFLALEHSIRHKGRFQEVDDVMQKYFTLGHAKVVPKRDMDKHPALVFYLPMHVVHKNTKVTTKVRAVFHASANQHQAHPSTTLFLLDQQFILHSSMCCSGSECIALPSQQM